MLAVVTIIRGAPARLDAAERWTPERRTGLVGGYLLVSAERGEALRVVLTEEPDALPATLGIHGRTADRWACRIARLDDGQGAERPPLDGEPAGRILARVATLARTGDAEAYRYQAERILPALRSQAGYRGGLWLVDEAAGKRRNFSFWADERALREATERIYAGYRAAGRAIPVEAEAVYTVAAML